MFPYNELLIELRLNWLKKQSTVVPNDFANKLPKMTDLTLDNIPFAYLFAILVRKSAV